MSTHNIPLLILKKSPEIFQNAIMYAAVIFLLGIQERVRNSRDKRAISVRLVCWLVVLGLTAL